MNLIRRLLRQAARTQKTAGLSTAELVGIIVIVGILGALGGTYVNGLVTQANTNAGTQNANTLNTVVASILAAGGTLNTGAPVGTDAAGGILDVDNAADCIKEVNIGVTVTSNGNPVLYQMTPAINSTASYNMGVNQQGNSVTFTYITGSTP